MVAMAPFPDTRTTRISAVSTGVFFLIRYFTAGRTDKECQLCFPRPRGTHSDGFDWKMTLDVVIQAGNTQQRNEGIKA